MQINGSIRDRHHLNAGVVDDHPVLAARGRRKPHGAPLCAHDVGGAGVLRAALRVPPARVVVIGGGAAGLAAARQLRSLGHAVRRRGYM